MQDDLVVVDVAKQVQPATKQHLWYSGGTLGGLAFFDQIKNSGTYVILWTGLAFFDQEEET